MQMMQPFRTKCPECGGLIHLANQPHEHHLLLCPHCEILLIVTRLEPIVVDWAFEEPDEMKTPFNPYFPYLPPAWQ